MSEPGSLCAFFPFCDRYCLLFVALACLLTWVVLCRYHSKGSPADDAASQSTEHSQTRGYFTEHERPQVVEEEPVLLIECHAPRFVCVPTAVAAIMTFALTTVGIAERGLKPVGRVADFAAVTRTPSRTAARNVTGLGHATHTSSSGIGSNNNNNVGRGWRGRESSGSGLFAVSMEGLAAVLDDAQANDSVPPPQEQETQDEGAVSESDMSDGGGSFTDDSDFGGLEGFFGRDREAAGDEHKGVEGSKDELGGLDARVDAHSDPRRPRRLSVPTAGGTGTGTGAGAGGASSRHAAPPPHEAVVEDAADDDDDGSSTATPPSTGLRIKWTFADPELWFVTDTDLTHALVLRTSMRGELGVGTSAAHCSPDPGHNARMVTAALVEVLQCEAFVCKARGRNPGDGGTNPHAPSSHNGAIPPPSSELDGTPRAGAGAGVGAGAGAHGGSAGTGGGADNLSTWMRTARAARNMRGLDGPLANVSSVPILLPVNVRLDFFQVATVEEQVTEFGGRPCKVVPRTAVDTSHPLYTRQTPIEMPPDVHFLDWKAHPQYMASNMREVPPMAPGLEPTGVYQPFYDIVPRRLRDARADAVAANEPPLCVAVAPDESASGAPSVTRTWYNGRRFVTTDESNSPAPSPLPSPGTNNTGGEQRLRAFPGASIGIGVGVGVGVGVGGGGGVGVGGDADGEEDSDNGGSDNGDSHSTRPSKRLLFPLHASHPWHRASVTVLPAVSRFNDKQYERILDMKTTDPKGAEAMETSLVTSVEVLNLDMSHLEVCVSYEEVMTILEIVGGMAPMVDTPVDASVPVGGGVPQTQPQASAAMQLAAANHPGPCMALRVHTHGFTATLISHWEGLSDSLPVAQVSVRPAIDALAGPQIVQAEVELQLQVKYHNHTIGKWEPMVEPWEALLNINVARACYRKQLVAQCRKRLAEEAAALQAAMASRHGGVNSRRAPSSVGSGLAKYYVASSASPGMQHGRRAQPKVSLRVAMKRVCAFFGLCVLRCVGLVLVSCVACLAPVPALTSCELVVCFHSLFCCFFCFLFMLFLLSAAGVCAFFVVVVGSVCFGCCWVLFCFWFFVLVFALLASCNCRRLASPWFGVTSV